MMVLPGDGIGIFLAVDRLFVLVIDQNQQLRQISGTDDGEQSRRHARAPAAAVISLDGGLQAGAKPARQIAQAAMAAKLLNAREIGEVMDTVLRPGSGARYVIGRALLLGNRHVGGQKCADMGIARALNGNLAARRNPIQGRQELFESAHGLAFQQPALTMNAGIHFVETAFDSGARHEAADKALITPETRLDFLTPGVRPLRRQLVDGQGMGEHGFDRPFRLRVARQYRLGDGVLEAIEHDRFAVRINRAFRIQ